MDKHFLDQFLFVALPLKIRGATGSMIDPLANVFKSMGLEVEVGYASDPQKPHDEVVDQFPDLGRTLLHHQFYHLLVTKVITGYDGVPDMFLQAVGFIGNSSYPALGILCVCFIQSGFCYKADLSMFCNFQRKTESRQTDHVDVAPGQGHEEKGPHHTDGDGGGNHDRTGNVAQKQQQYGYGQQ